MIPFQQKLRVGYVYIEESFDAILNIGNGGRGLALVYGSGKSPVDERVNEI